VINNVPEAELSAAVEHFEQSIAILGEIDARSELAYAHAGYGRLCGKTGRLTKARDNFMRALERFDSLGTLSEPERVREDLGGVS
jgi:tetratricopeptide (TPR) repeat protein